MAGQCECQPDCENRVCGGDGCGSTCGQCAPEEFCLLGHCFLPLALPDTGATTCYDFVEATACPVSGEGFFGQDGNYQMSPMSYTDHGDGTITDHVTGLVWAGCNGGQAPADCSGEAVALQYADGVGHCAGNMDGLPGEGWRLPNLHELATILHYEASGFKNSPPFDGIPGHYMWATPVGDNSKRCWASFGSGQTGCEYFPDEQEHYVRCVRGASRSSGDFVDNDDGTVTDKATTLTWQKTPAPKGGDWQQALAICETLELAGHDDWRLPNAREIGTLRDHSLPNEGLFEEYFEGPEDHYWSGTTFWKVVHNHAAYALHSNGVVGYFGDAKYGGLSIRCVRQECTPDCAGKECGSDGCGSDCGTCEPEESCADGICQPPCEPIFFGTAGQGVNNGWTCDDVCGAGGGISVDWLSQQEQGNYCLGLHPGAQVIVADPFNHSYPLFDTQNGKDMCLVNANGQKSQGWKGNGTPVYGDQVLCRCQKGC